MSSNPTLRETGSAAREIRTVEARATAEQDHEPAPVGTLFLMILFLAAIAGLWGTVYWILLSR